MSKGFRVVTHRGRQSTYPTCQFNASFCVFSSVVTPEAEGTSRIGLVRKGVDLFELFSDGEGEGGNEEDESLTPVPKSGRICSWKDSSKPGSSIKDNELRIPNFEYEN
jgi:hypothetical protein